MSTTQPSVHDKVSRGKRTSKRTKRSTPKGERFTCIDGKVDLAEGLILYRDVVSESFEKELATFVETMCEKGRRGEIKPPIYMRARGRKRSQGNRREAICYGGFFDFNRGRPGRRGMVPPFPPILERLTDSLIDEGLLPSSVRPDSCIINFYSPGDCIPPHVDHESYYRPISTLSLMGEEPILIGSRFRCRERSTWDVVKGKGLSVMLPRRSLLVLGGNSGNVAKHCISACKTHRISITLRKQPPPSWKPKITELVSGKKSRREKQQTSCRGDSEARSEDLHKERLRMADRNGPSGRMVTNRDEGKSIEEILKSRRPGVVKRKRRKRHRDNAAQRRRNERRLAKKQARTITRE